MFSQIEHCTFQDSVKVAIRQLKLSKGPRRHPMGDPIDYDLKRANHTTRQSKNMANQREEIIKVGWWMVWSAAPGIACLWLLLPKDPNKRIREVHLLYYFSHEKIVVFPHSHLYLAALYCSGTFPLLPLEYMKSPRLSSSSKAPSVQHRAGINVNTPDSD